MVIAKNVRAKYRAIESAYSRLLRVFLYVNQDALSMLPRENLDDIDSTISRVYESLFWARKSLTAKEDSGYSSLDWRLAGADRNEVNGMIAEVYELATERVIANCPQNLFTENALFRLMNSYAIASDVTKISLGILSARKNRQADFRGKR